jgi:hypothetical protein
MVESGFVELAGGVCEILWPPSGPRSRPTAAVMPASAGMQGRGGEIPKIAMVLRRVDSGVDLESFAQPIVMVEKRIVS